jgi:hypothetical protein
VDSKYDSSWGRWCSNGVHGSYGVGYEKYQEGLGSVLVFEVGDDSKIIFWHDICVMWGELVLGMLP